MKVAHITTTILLMALLAGCSPSNVVRNSRKDGSVKQVDKWLAHNWLDLRDRETIEWGKVEHLESGNYTVRYRFQANIVGGGSIVDDATFTFSNKGDFVSVSHADGHPKKVNGRGTANI